MQVEVDDKKKIPIRTDVERSRKESQRRFADEGVVFGGILPNGAKRPAMRDRDVIKLPVGRNNNAMRAIDIDWHVASVNLVIDAGSRWSKTYQSYLICAF